MSQLDWPQTPERLALAATLQAMCGGSNDELRRALDEGGITRIGVPESDSGSGGGDADLAVALRLLAGQARSVSLAETAFIGAWALRQCGHVEPDCQLAPAFEIGTEVAVDSGAGAWTISGTARQVPGVTEDSLVLVPVQTGEQWQLAVVPMDRVEIIPNANLAGESRAELHFIGAEAAMVLPLPAGLGWIDLHARLGLARAIQISGALLAVQNLTANYARTREQFGKPIAEQQVVAHLLAAIAEQALLAQAAVATAIESPTAWNCAIAKSVASRAARSASAAAHQVHGAMGMSQEYPLGSLTTRLWSWAEEGGRPEAWEHWIGQRFMQQDRPNLWVSIVNAMEGADR